MTEQTEAAFFDVDGTLTRGATLFRFLEFLLTAEGAPSSVYRAERQRLKAMTAMGVPRERTNRAYFENYAGRGAAYVARLAQEWYQAETRQGGLFHPAVLEACRRHSAAGRLTVLASGSFPALLAPIAAGLKADAVLCTRPEIRGGRYTGAVVRPMVGEEKARAVRRLAEDRAIALERSWAYGDHASDLPFLQVVGHPVVVGTGEPRLLAPALARPGWRRLPGAAAPSPVPAVPWAVRRRAA
ncbi:HAD family hydrolase [Streptomyces sp. NPDC059785]|uniref:HAD family hydrolase n=1 Tax=unclassified Streptomyces TaxID=2593676 RepID=UPI003646F6A9